MNEEKNQRFSDYKVEVQFISEPEGKSDADLFMSGFGIMVDEFEAEHIFSVKDGYTANYTIMDENEEMVSEGELSPGNYRLHNGRLCGIPRRR